jgi:hypothetical protein
VAYSLEVGAAGDLTNLVRITAPQPDKKFSVLGFAATAAWQVRDAGRLAGMRAAVFRGMVINRSDRQICVQQRT